MTGDWKSAGSDLKFLVFFFFFFHSAVAQKREQRPLGHTFMTAP